MLVASRLGDVAQIVLYGAVALVAVALLILVINRRFSAAQFKAGPFEAKLDSIESQLKAVATATDQVNKAVNQVPPNMPTLVARVARIEEINRHLLLSVRIIAGHVGAHIPPLRESYDERRSESHHEGDPT